MNNPDVVIVGGGVIGCAIAWQARRAGLAVTVVDESPGRGSTWAAAGMLAPITEAHYGEEPLLRLNLRSAELYPKFVAELEAESGREVSFVKSGTLIVARDRDELAEIEDLFRFQSRMGLDVQWLSRRDCRALEPALTPNVRGGIHVPSDHQIDNRALALALIEACSAQGVEFIPERVADVAIDHDRVRGVRTGTQTIESAHVVISAGCWSASLGLPTHVNPPIRPVKGQLLHLRTIPARGHANLLQRNVRAIGVYLVGRPDGRVVVGATVEERGFDTKAQVEAVLTLLRDAFEIVPGVLELEFVEAAVGLRPGTPDNAPIIGSTDVEGLIMATGHYRNGVLLTPLTARAVTAILTTGEVPDEIAGCALDRFAALSGVAS